MDLRSCLLLLWYKCSICECCSRELVFNPNGPNLAVTLLWQRVSISFLNIYVLMCDDAKLLFAKQ